MDGTSQATVTALARKQLLEARVPLYMSIANLIRNDILTGRRANGDKLPTIDKLMSEYGVARDTIRQAIAVVAEQGLLSVEQGRGTFVTTPETAAKRIHLETNWDQLLVMLEGNQPKLIEGVNCVEHLPPSDIQGNSTHSYRFMKRLHLVNKQPYAYLELYLDQKVYDLNPAVFDTQMIIPNIQQFSENPIKTLKQSFQIGSADLTLSTLLEINPNAPVGVVKRTIIDTEGQIIYVGLGYYRGDLVTFETSIDIPKG